MITYRHPRGSFVGQADHILLDAATTKEAAINTHVPNLGTDLSDHLPLVVDLDWD